MIRKVLYSDFIRKKSPFSSLVKNESKTNLSEIINRLFHHYFFSLIQLSKRLKQKNQTLMGILSLKITELPDALSLKFETLEPTTLYSKQKPFITH